jgi:hypothetical protein
VSAALIARALSDRQQAIIREIAEKIGRLAGTSLTGGKA